MMKMTGHVELERLFRSFPKEAMSNKIAMVALDAGAGVIKAQAASNASKIKDTGLLSKSIKVRKAKKKGATTRLVVIGPTHMKRAFRRTKSGKLRGVAMKRVKEERAKGTKITFMDPGNYAHLVEFGTDPHIIRPKNKKAITVGGEGGVLRKLALHPGTDPNPFMRPAFDAKKEQAAKKTADKLNALLIAHARGLLKRRRAK
jgi:HK97 gp10 family phage protein